MYGGSGTWSTSNSTYGYSQRSPINPTCRSHLGQSPIRPSHNPHYPKGLQNLTNTCYISAVLQCLFQIIKEEELPIRSKAQQKITALFFRLKNSKDTKDYQEFKTVLEDRVQIVRGWEQQDAHELLIGLLGQLQAQNSDRLTPGRADLSYKKQYSMHQNWKRFVSEMGKLQKSKIIRMFYGEVAKYYICPYGHKKTSFERYCDLSLSFSPKTSTSRAYFTSGPLRVVDMLSEYLGREEIEGLNCEECKKKSTFTKEAQLYTTPPFLILHLSRFMKGYYTDSNQKNKRQVQYHQILQVDEASTGSSVRYALIGVVHHMGSLNRGHYYADIKVGGEWYQMDDHRVHTTRVYEKSNVSKTAYILIYRKM